MYKFAFIAVLAFCAVAVYAEDVDEKDVMVLTEANFDEWVKDKELAAVEFYAPWCGHCKRLEPEWARAATILKDDNVFLGKVDATENSDLGSRFNVRGYPTIKVFRNGVDAEYKGGRTESEIVSYMKKQSGPASKVLSSVDEAEKLLGGDDVKVVLFHSGSDADAHAAFTSVANANREEFVFAESTAADVHSKYGASTPKVVLFNKDGQTEYKGEFNEKDILAFAKAERLPLVDEIGPANFMHYHEAELPLLWFFVDPDNQDMMDKYLPILKAVAPEFRGKVSIVHIDGVKYKGVLSKMGLSEDKDALPAMALEELGEKSDGHKFLHESGEISESTVKTFLSDYVAGKLQPHLKSEEIPTEQGPVTTVVGKNLEEIVFSDKDVLIEFYAPWCGHCKRLAPIWDQLGERYSDNDNLVIAKCDATANDVPKAFDVQGFPTIKFIKAGSRDIQEYEGGRDLKDFVKFLDENAKGPAEKKDEL